MRCLFCDKKLSLLKMAKGDSFCSPAHFDAYQLQVSKTAFDRLKAVQADEDAPKTPLVLKPKEQAPPPAATVPREAAAAPDEVAPLRTLESPPYAALAASTPTLCPPQPPTLVPNGPDDPPRELAYPLHEVEATAGLLNLHLGLQFEQIPPANWTRARDAAFVPVDFRPEPARPPLALEPDFSRPDCSEAETVVEPIPAEPDGTLPYYSAPSFRERSGEWSALDTASISEPRQMASGLIFAPAQPLEPPHGIALFAQFDRAAIEAAKNPGVGWIGSAPEAPALAVAVLSPARQEARFAALGALLATESGRPLETAWTRTVSALLPSPFETRRVDPEGPALDRRVPGRAELYPEVLTIFPSMQTASPPAAHARAPAPAMEFGWRSALVPFPVLEPRRFGADANRTILPAPPAAVADIAFEWPATRPLAGAADCLVYDCLVYDCLVYRAATFACPLFPSLPFHRTGWTGADSSAPLEAAPDPAIDPGEPRFSPAPFRISRREEAGTALFPVTRERGVAAAPSVLRAQPEAPYAGGTISRAAPGIPALPAQMSLCPSLDAWKPSVPGREHRQNPKLLPARHGAVLPKARNWPRLTLLPL